MELTAQTGQERAWTIKVLDIQSEPLREDAHMSDESYFVAYYRR
jgi:hypothetical protein